MQRVIPRLVVIVSLLVAATASASVAAAGGGCHGSNAEAREASTSVVKIDGCTFVPTVNRVPTGTLVTFLNSGTGPHDVSGTMGEWGSDLLEPGESFQKRFAEPGMYAYSCSLHPGMAGVVVAGDAGAAAAAPVGVEPVAGTAADGPTSGPSPVSFAAIGAGGMLLGAVAIGVLLRRRDQGSV
jgi:plastocyanin